MSNDRTHYAYSIYHKGVSIYVGAGSGIRTSVSRYRQAKKLGVSRSELTVVKIADGLTIDQAHELERSLIAAIGRRCDGGWLINISTGGPVGATGVARSPEHIAKIVASRRGQKHTAEARAKMSAALRGKPGRPPSSETRAKMSAARRAYLARAPPSAESNHADPH